MLTDPDVIRVLIARLIAARSPVFVFVDGAEERYATTLLEADAQRAALICDELHPSHGHARMRAGASLKLSSRLDGVELRFRSNVRAVDADGRIAAYMIDQPLCLDYREHRGLYRLRASNLRARLDSADARADARVLDISAGGIRLAVAPPHPIGADQIWLCRLALPNGDVDAEIAVVRVRPARARTHAREDDIGARFGALSDEAARRIGRYVADAQRETLRARKAATGISP